MRYSWIVLLVGALALPALGGCSSPDKKGDMPPVTEGRVGGGLTGNPNEPDWVSNPWAAYPGSRTEILLATGTATMKSLELARQAAEKRAARRIAETLSQKVQAMTTDYQASAQDFYDDETGSAIENVESVQRTISNESLAGCFIDKVWRNDQITDRYEIHALVALKWDGVAQAYKEKMAAAIRERFKEKTDAQREGALGKLDEQIDRLSGEGFGE